MASSSSSNSSSSSSSRAIAAAAAAAVVVAEGTAVTVVVLEVLEIVGSYRYLGVYLDEFLTYRKGVGLLADSGCRALSSIRAKFKTFGNVNYDKFKKLFETGVVPIIDRCSGIWGYNDFECTNNAQNRAMRFFWG